MEILLVDDNDLIRVRLEKAIRKLDDDITIYNSINCEEALMLFSQINPDLVILDISLPDGSGIDLLRIMKKEKPQISVSIFTNYGTAEFKKSCIELGAEHFFEKSNINGLIDSIGVQHKCLININEVQMNSGIKIKI